MNGSPWPWRRVVLGLVLLAGVIVAGTVGYVVLGLGPLRERVQGEIERLAARPTIRILDGGHWPQRKNPQKVNSLLEDFLRTEVHA